MEISDEERRVVEGVCAAMQAGASGLDSLMALFADDSVLVEPFSGAVITSEGKTAIRRRCEEMMAQPRPPEFRLAVDRVDRDGGEVVADWTCTAAVMPAPMTGRDRYEIRNGKIVRLAITITGMPQI